MPSPIAAPKPRAYVANKRKEGSPGSPRATFAAGRRPVAAKIDYKAYKRSLQMGVPIHNNPPSPVQTQTSPVRTQGWLMLSNKSLKKILDWIFRTMTPSSFYEA